MFEDVDEVIAADTGQHRRYCAFSVWAGGLRNVDGVRARELVRDESYTCRALARYFAIKGADLNAQVITRHRNKKCCGQ